MKHSHKIVFAFLLGGALALALTNCSGGDPSEAGISDPISSSSGDGGSSSSSSGDGGSSSSSSGNGDSSSSSSDNGDDVSSSSANVCNGLTYDPVAQFCLGIDILDKCDGATYTATQKCDNGVVKTECGSGWYDASTQFCYNSNSSKVGNFCGINPQESYDPDLYECKPSSNGIYLKGGVTHENQIYRAVLIGTQTWMAENLNYATNNSWCYDKADGGDNSNCDTYGRLYNWEAATAPNICPDGWHVPTNADWNKLLKYVDDDDSDSNTPYTSYTAGNYLKATNGWNCEDAPPGNGTDAYGFSALSGGFYNKSTKSDSFENAGCVGYWWSASQHDIEARAHYRSMSYEDENVQDGGLYKTMGLSLRCVQDYSE